MSEIAMPAERGLRLVQLDQVVFGGSSTEPKLARLPAARYQRNGSAAHAAAGLGLPGGGAWLVPRALAVPRS